jgi:hypothetical protein
VGLDKESEDASLDEATTYFGGEHYFPYVSALPMLIKVKVFL